MSLGPSGQRHRISHTHTHTNRFYLTRLVDTGSHFGALDLDLDKLRFDASQKIRPFFFHYDGSTAAG